MLKRSINKQQIEKSIHIPYELMQFVQRNTYSLLIKGYAGTGKTTLSLSILRALKIKSNFFYISTRVSPKQLFLYYPWLGKFIEQSKTSGSDETSEQGYNLSSFEDARLDEPESLFERITNQLMDVKAPIIIIDSWDAIASFMDKEARLNNERVLQTWRERAGAKLIFISEDPKDTTLDFLVDGIVELGQKFYDNIRIREVFLSKLRGVRINKPSYIYTLNNGIFRSYNAYQPTEFMITCKPRISFKKKEKKIPPLSEDLYIASGYQGLDIALGGGFPKKGVVLIEIDSHINTRVTMTFLARIISNFVLTYNPILFQLFDGFDPSIVITYLESYLPAASKNRLIKIFCPADKVEVSSDYIIPYQNCNDFEKRFEFFRDIVLKTRQENPEKLLLNIMNIDMYQNVHKDGQINKMEIMPFIRENTDLSLLVIQHPQNILKHLSGVYDTHLRLTIINGTLFLQSLLPWNHLFAIVTDRSSGYPKIKLESVV
ncbi:MAG TPA: gas vesicle protein GvpD P-loop domain-containing protein [Nitrososphaeraceae archaeon]|nr:gas vesicle protein GvpD P-loop domain-containing protein [Nitrososphaeraceae archaeon]